MAHIVTATLIVAKTGDTERYFDKGAVLPTSVSADEKKRLVAAGLVKYEKDAPAATTTGSADKESSGQKPKDDEKPDESK